MLRQRFSGAGASVRRAALLRAEALPLQPPAAISRRICFSGQHVDRCIGEIVQSAGVIEIQVGQHDMPHVVSRPSQRLHL